MNAVQRSVVGRQSTSGGGRDDEPVDERLKGIEPKMIELISNEVLYGTVFLKLFFFFLQRGLPLVMEMENMFNIWDR